MPDDQLLALDDRWAVRLERRLAHPVEKVWRAVTEPAHLNQWFPSEVEVDLRVGGDVRFTFGDGSPGDVVGDVMAGRVTDLDPPRLFAFTWEDEHIRLDLTPDGDGTLLVLTHTFDDRPGAASYAGGWHTCLAALGPVLAGEPVPHGPRPLAYEQAAVERFGLDQPVVEADGDRWTARWERQLTCPADVAWDLFLGRDAATGEQRTAPAVGEPLTPFAAPEVVLGTVTEVSAPEVLAFAVADGEPGDHVRLELHDRPGQGARLVLTATGTDPAERDAALDQWGAGAVAHVAAEALAWAEDHAPA